MAMKRCPVCGEKYSDTYPECPFCEEEAAFQDGDEIRRTGGGRGGRRAAGRQNVNLITPTLVVLILIMAGLLVYLLWGDKLAAKVSQTKTPSTPPVEDTTPAVQPDVSASAEGEENGEDVTGEGEDGAGEGEAVDTPETGADTQTPASADASDYDTAALLPDGLTLSTTDFTLKNLGESATIKVSGGSGSYTWISQDEGIASVDSSGKVIAVSGGTTNVLVTDGSKKGVCIVRVAASGSLPATTAHTSSGGATLNKEDFTLPVGDPDVQLKISGVTTAVTWASSNTSVATVSDSGVVKAVGKGTATITATYDGTTLTCIVRVPR